jgi:hypothetical protein
MKVLRDEAAPAADQKVIDDLRTAVQQLTPVGRRKLLAIVARRCLEEADWTEFPLFNDEGRPFSYVMALPRPEDEFYAELTPALAAEIRRRALTPEDAIPWREMLAQIEADDDQESAAARSPNLTAPSAGP